MIQKFRKKPIEVEALLWSGVNHREMFDFLTWNEWDKKAMTASGEHFYIDFNKVACGLVIKTNEGDMIANVGDYIIREPFPSNNRLFYPCKPDIFEKTYEPVTS